MPAGCSVVEKASRPMRRIFAAPAAAPILTEWEGSGSRGRALAYLLARVLRLESCAWRGMGGYALWSVLASAAARRFAVASPQMARSMRSVSLSVARDSRRGAVLAQALDARAPLRPRGAGVRRRHRRSASICCWRSSASRSISSQPRAYWHADARAFHLTWWAAAMAGRSMPRITAIANCSGSGIVDRVPAGAGAWATQGMR